ncbi:MAG: hypothetical protein ACO1NO_00395, partial [Burkholderiaceae bacterium]
MTSRNEDLLHSAARRKALRLSIGGLGAAFCAPLLAQAQVFPPARPEDVPYEPTPQAMVDRMLALAGVTEDDLLYDLGCGD